MIFVFLIVYAYMAACGYCEGAKAVELGSQDDYHDARTIVSVMVFILVCMAAHGFHLWIVTLWISGNALYNRVLVWRNQGSITAANDGTFDIGIGKLKVSIKYLWGTTGKPELFFTFPVFLLSSILLASTKW